MDDPNMSYSGEYRDTGETGFRNDSKFLKMIVPVGFVVMLVAGLVIGVANIGKANKVKTNASGLTLSDVQSRAGLSYLSYGNVGYSSSGLQINEYTGRTDNTGVYEVKAVTFPCQVGQNVNGAICEPDKFELRYGSVVSNVFGLGMQASANQVAVADILDTSFGVGHILTTDSGGNTVIDTYESDIGRMRTPVVVLPEKSTIIAYLQPEVKTFRLSRNKQYACPGGSTCLVFKKSQLYPEGQPAPLLIVKGIDIADAYKLYYKYLSGGFGSKAVSDLGLTFRKPHKAMFGLNWETWDEYGSTATKDQIRSAIDKILVGIAPAKLDTVTIGSGYWSGSPTSWITGNDPATDTLKISTDRYPIGNGLDGMNDLFKNYLIPKGIVPIIGMRHTVKTGNSLVGTGANTQVVKNLFGYNPYFGTTTNSTTIPLFSPVAPANKNSQAILDLFNPAVTDKWVGILKQYYGNSLGGIKEDDMNFSDQKKVWSSATRNLPDNLTSKAYARYYLGSGYGDNFLIYGRGNWFSMGTDAADNQGWMGNFNPPNLSTDFYKTKYLLDSNLTQVVSGYPISFSELGSSRSWSGQLNPSMPTDYQKEYLRMQQLSTYFGAMGVSLLPNNAAEPYQSQSWFTYKLRKRLQQYVYDNAMKWYETGEPWVMRPLFMDYGASNVAVYAMYGMPSATDSINNRKYPWDEYMFGNALLVRPILTSTDVFDVYLPPGKWAALLKAGLGILDGNKMIGYDANPITAANAYPVFLKEGQVLPISSSNMTKMQVFVLLSGISKTENYKYHKDNGEVVTLWAEKDGSGRVWLKSDKNSVGVEMFNTAAVNFNKGYYVADDIDSILNTTTVACTIPPPVSFMLQSCGDGISEFKWNQVPGVTGYALRIDDSPNSYQMYNLQPGDTQEDLLDSNWISANCSGGFCKYVRATVAGHTYHAWVHSLAPASCNLNPSWSAQFDSYATCPSTPVTCTPPVSPDGLVQTCSDTTSEFRWNQATGADGYLLRIDDESSGWSGSCASLAAGDICETLDANWVSSHCIGGVCKYITNTTRGRSYHMWIHSIYPVSCNPSPGYSSAVGMTTKCPLTGPITCASWTNVWINGCTSNAKYTSSPRAAECNTSLNSLTINNNVTNASFARYQQVTPTSKYCTDASINWTAPWVDYSGQYQSTFSLNAGDNKICVQFKNSDTVSAACGSLIYKQ